MKNYEKVVELQKAAKEENARKATEAINYLYSHGKLVTVKELVKLTGLSRSYFYKNEKVNALLKKTLQLQGKILTEKNEVFNRALEQSYRVLEKQVAVLQDRCDRLAEENERLKAEGIRLKGE